MFSSWAPVIPLVMEAILSNEIDAESCLTESFEVQHHFKTCFKFSVLFVFSLVAIFMVFNEPFPK